MENDPPGPHPSRLVWKSPYLFVSFCFDTFPYSNNSYLAKHTSSLMFNPRKNIVTIDRQQYQSKYSRSQVPLVELEN